MVKANPCCEIARGLRLIVEPGSVFEVRIPRCRERPNSSFTSTNSGYFTFDKIDDAAKQIALIDSNALAPGIYVTLNPVRIDLLARSANRMNFRASSTTTDADVGRRRWLLIDVDPVRPSGISSTRQELAASEQRAQQIRDFLHEQGWPDPARAMSGNGHHLYYRVDLPGDDAGLIERVLSSLSDRFTDNEVSVDKSVFNPARIVRLIGTMARKGDDLREHECVEDRPHRRSMLIDEGDPDTIVSKEQLESITGLSHLPTTATPSVDAHSQLKHSDLQARARQLQTWLAQHSVEVTGTKIDSKMARLFLDKCPVIPEIVSGSGTDIAIVISGDASIAYCNKHNRGSQLKWRDVEEALDSTFPRGCTDSRWPDDDVPVPNTSPPVIHGKSATEDPGPVPHELLRVPGFIDTVMEFSMSTAPYPNRVLSFCAAITLLAFLAGRKVRDAMDNRTNLYMLGLAHSAAGKDHPRKVNSRILFEIGLGHCVIDRCASGEGLEDALLQNPAVLIQNDEIDGMLRSISQSKDGQKESMMSMLLTLYSSANTVYQMRRKAGQTSSAFLNQPCAVLFGTAIPRHYYDALSERMLTNGLFSRMVILEAGARSPGQETKIREIPDEIIDVARWWKDYCPEPGDLSTEFPKPTVISQDEIATKLLAEFRRESESRYSEAESKDDVVATTVWGRASEQSRKLALLYAISANHKAPAMGRDAVTWATSLVQHQIYRMLYMAHLHVSESRFQSDCLRVLRKLSRAEENCVKHSDLLKHSKLRSCEFSELMATLIDRNEVWVEETPRNGAPSRKYHLVKEPSGAI